MVITNNNYLGYENVAYTSILVILFKDLVTFSVGFSGSVGFGNMHPGRRPHDFAEGWGMNMGRIVLILDFSYNSEILWNIYRFKMAAFGGVVLFCPECDFRMRAFHVFGSITKFQDVPCWFNNYSILIA